MPQVFRSVGLYQNQTAAVLLTDLLLEKPHYDVIASCVIVWDQREITGSSTQADCDCRSVGYHEKNDNSLQSDSNKYKSLLKLLATVYHTVMPSLGVASWWMNRWNRKKRSAQEGQIRTCKGWSWLGSHHHHLLTRSAVKRRTRKKDGIWFRDRLILSPVSKIRKTTIPKIFFVKNRKRPRSSEPFWRGQSDQRGISTIIHFSCFVSLG